MLYSNLGPFKSYLHKGVRLFQCSSSTPYILPFSPLPFFDVLLSSPVARRLSLDSLHGGDKFHSFLASVLRVLAQLLEATSLAEVGRHADEILDYLKTILTAQPKQSVECVQQLLKALFGTNFASHSDDVVKGAMQFAETVGGM